MKNPILPALIGYSLIFISLYYFWRAVDLVSGKTPYFLSSTISLLVGLLLLHYGVKIVEKRFCARRL